MKTNYAYDLIVIGSGPGGYVAAIKAAQLKLKCLVIEKDLPGGVCLNSGCIPSKSLIHQAKIVQSASYLTFIGCEVNTQNLDYQKVFLESRRAAERLSSGVVSLLKKNRIDYRQATATIIGPNSIKIDDGSVISARFILVATGSRPRQIPGFSIDEAAVLSSTGALMLEKLPTSIIILGSGAIGIEFAYIFASFGVKVTVLEMLETILPLEDKEHSAIVARELAKRGVDFITKARATQLQQSNQTVTLTYERDGVSHQLNAQKLLVAVGRQPNSENLGLEAVGITPSKGGFIPVGDYYQTKIPSIYAIGDVIDSPMLAHVASKEGELAVLHMAGQSSSDERRIDPNLIPSAVYCEPEVASFGPTKERSLQLGIKVKVSVIPFRAIGKAVAVDEAIGQLKLLTDEASGEIIGAHIVGPQATELIHQLLLAKKAELLPEDIATMIHAHPTLSEGVMELSRASEEMAIHI